MAEEKPNVSVIEQILTEEDQAHETRRPLFVEIEKELKKPVVSFFTSFRFPVLIQDRDVDVLESIFQTMDLSKGVALIINSPGGYGVSAERIINVCRKYSGTAEYWAIVPNKAKSAATMICFGAALILMGETSELGPIDPQLTLPSGMRCSVYNVLKSYQDLFARAIGEKGRIEPYLQQLFKYDEREIMEYKDALKLSENIAIESLRSGMMKNMPKQKIRKKMKIFLTPERKKAHGRPIYKEEASKCGLIIKSIDTRSKLWQLIQELYMRSNNFVSSRAAKLIESRYHSIGVPAPQRKGD